MSAPGQDSSRPLARVMTRRDRGWTLLVAFGVRRRERRSRPASATAGAGEGRAARRARRSSRRRSTS